MQIHSLGLDICEEEYSLIGIHTALEDFKLAYLLNKKLGTSFYKAKEDLNFEEKQNETSFSIFNYSNNKYDFEWFLIANSSKRENQKESNELLLTSETKTYLIPEKKKVDFFIKISGSLQYNFVEEIINKIKTIDQVITSYIIDKNKLKSKDFLIF
ncbi:IPExxxVDY family protein [Polaribacter vadi]|uniref:IPExxxVDY family protein n=1 Tax=Polaribacter TaxID=52959 RepID=UPI001C0834C6|nr:MULTISPECIES: IPExxxVDY family protein [Polaribacter]MBU3011229.1 IPExxxVDY family protein [Polaribacter vadi]MDO6741042.1 IPExxxVDY family protein [Polaribacter sp. 1_MG-2023]